jgi:hypothetical protein
VSHRHKPRTNYPAQFIRELATGQARSSYPFSFTTEASIDLASDEELMDQMVDSSFTQFLIGIEPPNTTSLTGAGKHQNTRIPLLEAVDAILLISCMILATA